MINYMYDNWLIENINSQEDWDRVIIKLYNMGVPIIQRHIDSCWHIHFLNEWSGYFEETERYNIGFENGQVTYNWHKESIEKYHPKVIECDEFLKAEENT